MDWQLDILKSLAALGVAAIIAVVGFCVWAITAESYERRKQK